MKLLFRFNALRHTSLVFLLWWDKRWKPLSLTLMASHTLIAKIAFLNKDSKADDLSPFYNRLYKTIIRENKSKAL